MTTRATAGPRPLQVFIVDDEAPARLRLAALVRDCAEPRAEVVGEAGNAAQALAWLLDHPACDVVLLDIAMPGQTGLRFATELKRLAQVPAVVFVTAHPQHALAAFELDAADYLTKPVRRERLAEALARVAQRRARYDALPQDVPVLVATDRGRVVRVPIAEVLYLRAEMKYVTLRTAAGSHVLDESLTELEPRLGPSFLRVHRNALVARHAVRALARHGPQPVLHEADAERAGDDDAGTEGWAVQIAPVGEWLAVSRRQLGAVREALAAIGAG